LQSDCEKYAEVAASAEIDFLPDAKYFSAVEKSSITDLFNETTWSHT